MPEAKVVEGIGISSNVAMRGQGKVLAAAIQRAMGDAILACTAEGISTEEKNSSIIKARMMAARQAVLDQWNGKVGEE